MSDQTDLDMDSVDAILTMHSGDFTRVAIMLRERKPMHFEVRAVLAEYLSEGNSHGRLIFKRPRGRAPRDPWLSVLTAVTDWREVQAQVEKCGGVEAAIRFVAENNTPRRSYETVRESYYLADRLQKRLDEDAADNLQKRLDSAAEAAGLTFLI